MNEFYLYISSHFFILPVFLSIYCERYDVLWISTSILCTSLLRWGEPKKIIYQYIDHNWVKLVFLYLFISMFYVFVENTLSMYEVGFLTETSRSWLDGGIHFGFNISREFILK